MVRTVVSITLLHSTTYKGCIHGNQRVFALFAKAARIVNVINGGSRDEQL